MRDRRRATVANPALVGAVTVLITVVAVFLAYNANDGLPFVPTYDLTAQLPDAEKLVPNNEVRIAGKRVGLVTSITATTDRSGRPIAELSLKLDEHVAPLRDDTTVRVRPRSNLGLKYLELTPGRRGRPIPDRGRLGLAAARPVVEFDDFVSAFDATTRRAQQRVLHELGDALAGRGQDVNRALTELPLLMPRLRRVSANLTAEETRLPGFVRGAARFAGELAASERHLGSAIGASERTTRAMAETRRSLAATVRRMPATEQAVIRGLRASRPLLRDAAGLMRDLRPAADVAGDASRRLSRALTTGAPVLRRSRALARRLGATLEALRSVSADAGVTGGVTRLMATIRSAAPTLRYLAPLQVRCNYAGLWTRNVTSVISEGDSSGTWFRIIVMRDPDQYTRRATPAPHLHANPYPAFGAPGQLDECEAGREPFLPGLQIGNVPGSQGDATDWTAVPEEPAGG
jgi:virulence factor Mce-like protein